MNLGRQLASLGLHTLAAAADLAGCEAADKLGGAVGQLLRDRFGDGSRRLLDALRQSTQRSWSALETALAGDTLRQKLSTVTGRAEDRIFASGLQTFLATVPLGDAHDSEESARRKALAELRHARQAGLLGAGIDGSALEAAAEPLAQFTSGDTLLDAQEKTLRALAASLHDSGYVYLARLLVVRPSPGQPLLVLALAYFFRRAVEADEILFRGLALERLRQLQVGVESGFAALELALDLHADRLEVLLDDVHELLAETRDAVLDIGSQLGNQSEQLRTIGAAVQQLLEQHRMHRREVRPGDSLTLRDDGERLIVRQLVDRYHALPPTDRAYSPALLNAIGKLEVISGDFDGAHRDFQAVATLVADSALRAEAHFNAYRAALEQRNNEGAMQSLQAALADDARRFTPVPLETYQPETILGAGGFGVALLCRHRFMQARVVVKALWLEPLGVAAEHVFREAHLLRQLDHPGIIRITDCGYVDVPHRDRPYIVMDYFEGESLDQYLKTHRTLSVEDYCAVATQIAAGLQAAHAAGILHRDVKPANLLVRYDRERWQVRLIDFGLAMRHQRQSGQTAHTTTRAAKTLLGQSIAGTLSYAAPEQLLGGNTPIGPPADVYAFARTSCQLLFGTTHPLPRHWQSLPSSLANLLGHCLEEDPADRPADFAVVLACLGANSPLQPFRPEIGDAIAVLDSPPAMPPVVKPASVGEPFDAEMYTSIIELTRLARRELGLGLFEIAGAAAFPYVARSYDGGYETMRLNLVHGEKVHPARELRRLIVDQNRQGRSLDDRLEGRLAELTSEARIRLAATPASLVALGCVALGMLAACPFFAILIALSAVETAPFVLAIIFTAVSGAVAVVNGILSIITLVQHLRLKQFGREVVLEIEPLLRSQSGSAPPLLAWPGPSSTRRMMNLLAATALLVVSGLTGLFLVLRWR